MIKKIILPTALLLVFELGRAQNLFPEKFGGCTFSSFCLDCGEIKGAYNGDLTAFFAEKFQSDKINNIEGVILVQVLIDTIGRQCVLSIGNKATGRVSKLDLRNTINAMSGWKPAFDHGKPTDVSITLKFTFSNGECHVSYDRFDPSAVTNRRSVGEAEITKKTSNSKLLKNEFEVYTTQNSVIPWDMTRAISVDTNNIAWLGTDNGIVRIENKKLSVFTPRNSPLRASGNETNIMSSCVDIYNNKWFTDNLGNVYKYDDAIWTVYDSKNSPVKGSTGIYSDKSGNVWFFGFDGLIKYDGKSWSVMDMANSKLPSNRIMGVFVDSKKRLWIGTDKGNIMIDGSVVEDFTTTDNPLTTSILSKGYEDKEGNIWFSLYEKFPQKKGFAKYSPNREWTVINTDNSKMPRNDVLDFAINEKTNTIWFSINRVGISEFDGENWSTFTPENSKVPSTYIQSIAIDKDGNLWCATFAGLLKVIPK